MTNQNCDCPCAVRHPCPERSEDCHSRCREYLAWVAAREEAKAESVRAAEANKYLRDYATKKKAAWARYKK